ncbi:MAG: sialidase family protein, partial [Steroidobacteraceae bacterium]
PGYWGHGTGGNGIWVLRSPDGGKTWDPAPVGVKVWKGDEPDVKLEDMPRIWSDTGASSPHRGNLYMAWIEWQLEQSIILYSRSSDGGQTWAAPMRISTRAGLPRDDNGAVVGPIGTVAPDGTIYVIWNEGFNVTLAISKDGGRSFKPSRPIFDVAAPYFGGASGIPGVARCMGFPQVGIDPKLGRLYVTWSDFRNGDVDVFISRSDDHGSTWTAPMRVNNDPIHDGADQFLQWMAVDATDGSVNVQFYDRRDDPANRLTRVTLARSTDHGQSFTNYAWRAEPFATDNAFLGDYEWLVALGGRVFGTWAEPAPAGYVVVVPRAPSTVASRAPTIIRVGSADFRAAH